MKKIILIFILILIFGFSDFFLIEEVETPDLSSSIHQISLDVKRIRNYLEKDWL